MGTIALIWAGPHLHAALGQSADWVSFQGGPAHRAAAVDDAMRPPLKRTWVAGAPGNDHGLSAAAVTAGVAVATGRTSLVGFDPASGAQLWTRSRAQGPLVPPAVDPASGPHGLVVYVEGNGATTSGLVGIDLSTRKQLWRVPLGDASISAPAIEGGLAFVGARDRFVYAIDVSAGALRWKVRSEGVVDSAPAADGARVYVVSESSSLVRSRVYALDGATGHIDWTYSPTSHALDDSSVTVADGRVYVGLGDTTVRTLDAASGRLVWSAPVRGDFSPSSSPAVSGGSLYLQDREGGVYRLERATGRLVWDFQFASIADSGAPMVVGGNVFVGLEDGTVAALSTASGHVLWRTQLRFGAIGPLAPAGGLLLVPSMGSTGGIAPLQPVQGPLLDEHSPTELNVPVALVRYAAAFALMLAVVLGLFGGLGRRAARTMGEAGTETLAETVLEPEEKGRGQGSPDDDAVTHDDG